MAPNKSEKGNHQKPRKRNKGPIHQYSQEQLSRALNEIKVNGMSKLQASKVFGIPRTTLRDKISEKTSEMIERVGKKCTLGKDIENKLVEWILTNAANGFPVNKEGLIYSVQKIVEKRKIATSFIANKPGRKWFNSFLKRNPIVRQKHAEYINKARASISEKRIRDWFSEVRTLLKDDVQALNHPQRIWNMDETALFLSPKGALVLAERGRPTYDITSTSEKDNVTTLITVNALGELAPPLTIFKYDRLPRAVIEAAPSNWGIGKSDTGWMQSENFFEYFANVFHPFLAKNNIERPVVVFLDGHASHLSLALSSFCRENQIILVCLPPNATHIMQPLDVAFFHPLKQKWKGFARKWMYEHDGFTMTKKDVPSALSRILQEKTFSNSIISGFRTSGLYPFDDNGVNYTKCIKRTSANNQQNKNSGQITDPPEISQNITALLQIIESRVNETTVLDLFERTYESKSHWEGDRSYLELYKLWASIKNSDIETTDLNKLSEDISSSQITQGFTHNTTETSQVIIGNEGLLSFPFPEWNEADDQIDNRNIALEKKNEHHNIITVTAEIHQEPSAAKETDNSNLGFEVAGNADFESVKQDELKSMFSAHSDLDEIAIVPEPSENKINILQNIVLKAKETKKNSETDESNTKIILPNSGENVNSVLKDILYYPNPKPRQKRRRVENWPSVLTSDQWIEIAESKEKERITKEEIKKERQRTREENKARKSEKLKKRTKAKVTTNVIGDEPKDMEKVQHYSEREMKIGSFVIVRYDNLLYPAEVLQTDNDSVQCQAMERCGLYWKWPRVPDVIWYDTKDIIQVIPAPKSINSRGMFSVDVDLID